MKKAFTAILALTLLIAVVITAMAAPLGINRVTSDTTTLAQTANLVETNANSVSWNIETKEGAILVVSGPNGYYYNTQFASKGTPFLNTHGLSDGLYTYELLLVNNVAVDGQRTGASAPVATLTGAFSIVDGTPLHEVNSSSDLDGSTTTNNNPMLAQVFTTDVIVQGSQCVGVDCVNGESFSFDTFRLKENNLRIHFDDTSSSASFPSNDWRIIANDSSNGGANYLAIEDSTAGNKPFYVAAGAGNNALYVSSSGGNVGMGTASPVVELHVADGDSPTLRLEQNGASGFTPQTWDIAGNETNFFVRDVTNGSLLPFKIKPSAPTNSLFVAADGDIGFGTQNPSGQLHIENGTNDFIITNDTSVGIGTDAPSQSLHIVGTDGTTQILVEDTSGSALGERTMFSLQGHTGPRMTFVDTSISSSTAGTFQLGMSASQRFIINGLDSSGGEEFTLFQNGTFQIRTGGTKNLEVDINGNLQARGTITELTNPRPARVENLNLNMSVLPTIDVFMANAEKVDTTDEGEFSRAVNHLAIDGDAFNAAYGVGETGSIAPMDVAIAAFASAQSLSQEVEQLKAENAELEARISELEALVNTLIEETGK